MLRLTGMNLTGLFLHFYHSQGWVMSFATTQWATFQDNTRPIPFWRRETSFQINHLNLPLLKQGFKLELHFTNKVLYIADPLVGGAAPPCRPVNPVCVDAGSEPDQHDFCSGDWWSLKQILVCDLHQLGSGLQKSWHLFVWVQGMVWLVLARFDATLFRL